MGIMENFLKKKIPQPQNSKSEGKKLLISRERGKKSPAQKSRAKTSSAEIYVYRGQKNRGGGGGGWKNKRMQSVPVQRSSPGSSIFSLNLRGARVARFSTGGRDRGKNRTLRSYRGIFQRDFRARILGCGFLVSL